ncbi:MAG: 2-amino-4-hydroxy-6-hydroxymethyldihydropteridine diphosphokinase [Lachnospiraceae bacterium]|nr:2-amino-4-hydroxy-6-hydroxymethyldihydropteridine diphosphokinase [Candidatus Merdinaster equi]
MDEIRIKGLKVFAHHGCLPEETRNGQDFYVNATLYVDNRYASVNDDLNKVINYAEVVSEITKEMQENTCKLIETVAENVAERVLVSFGLCRAIDVEIVKPDAPIDAQFESVAVKIHRKRHVAYLGIGSNLGNSDETIAEAVAKLGADCRISSVRTSSIITTKPYGVEEQPDFRNAAIEIETVYSPAQLLVRLHEIENEAGRVRTLHWGPRTLDLDILFYDHLVMKTDDLIIPHADLHNRDFVLGPMMELAPEYVHPIMKMSVSQMYEKLGGK